MSEPKYARGWAVQQGGEILINTVASTARDSMAGYLFVTCRVGVHGWWTEEQVRTMFEAHAKPRGARAVEIKVSLK